MIAFSLSKKFWEKKEKNVQDKKASSFEGKKREKCQFSFLTSITFQRQVCVLDRPTSIRFFILRIFPTSAVLEEVFTPPFLEVICIIRLQEIFYIMHYHFFLHTFSSFFAHFLSFLFTFLNFAHFFQLLALFFKCLYFVSCFINSCSKHLNEFY